MNTSKLTVKSILACLALACFAVTGFAACAAPVDSNESEPVAAKDEKVGEAEEAQLGQCCIGYWRCPATNATWDWFTGPAICSDGGERTTYSSAHTKCETACDVTCTLVQQGCYWP